MTDSAKSSSVQWQRKREQKWLCTFRTATLQVRHPSAWRVGVVSFLAALGPPEQRRRLCSGPAWPPSLFQGPVKGALQDQGSTRRCTAEALVRKYPSPPRHSGTEARPPLRRASRLTRQGFSSTDGGEGGLAQRRPSSHPPWGQGCRGQSGAFSSATSAPCQGAAPGGVSRGDAPLRRNRAASPTLLPPPPSPGLGGAPRRCPRPAARLAGGGHPTPAASRKPPPPHTHTHTHATAPASAPRPRRAVWGRRRPAGCRRGAGGAARGGGERAARRLAARPPRPCPRLAATAALPARARSRRGPPPPRSSLPPLFVPNQPEQSGEGGDERQGAESLGVGRGALCERLTPGGRGLLSWDKEPRPSGKAGVRGCRGKRERGRGGADHGLFCSVSVT